MDERTYGSGAGDGENYDPKNVSDSILEKRIKAMEFEMEALRSGEPDRGMKSRGRNSNEHKRCDELAKSLDRTSFTLGDACKLLGMEWEKCAAFLEHMCELGCIDCPKDRGDTLGRQQYRLTRQTVVDAIGLQQLG